MQLNPQSLTYNTVSLLRDLLAYRYGADPNRRLQWEVCDCERGTQSLLTCEDDTPRMSHVGNNETLLYQLDGVLRDMSL